MVDIYLYENSDEIPAPREYPRTPWTHDVTNGQKYNLAFEIPEEEREATDDYFAMLIGHRLRYEKGQDFDDAGRFIGFRPLKWKEAFQLEREALAWMAFAKDIGDYELYEVIDGKRTERTRHRDHVWKLFGARLPERIAGKPADILEQTHVKREKNANRRGESYWRKGHQPPASDNVKTPTQGGLFQ